MKDMLGMTDYFYKSEVEKAKAKLRVDIEMYKLQPLLYKLKHWQSQSKRKHMYKRLSQA